MLAFLSELGRFLEVIGFFFNFKKYKPEQRLIKLSVYLLMFQEDVLKVFLVTSKPPEPNPPPYKGMGVSKPLFLCGGGMEAGFIVYILAFQTTSNRAFD